VRCCADTFISKTKKLYLDTRTQRNIAKLSEDLSEVQQIMTRNIAEVLGQGERLDRALPPSFLFPLILSKKKKLLKYTIFFPISQTSPHLTLSCAQRRSLQLGHAQGANRRSKLSMPATCVCRQFMLRCFSLACGSLLTCGSLCS
jgi:hypothetical protein